MCVCVCMYVWRSWLCVCVCVCMCEEVDCRGLCQSSIEHYIVNDIEISDLEAVIDILNVQKIISWQNFWRLFFCRSRVAYCHRYFLRPATLFFLKDFKKLNLEPDHHTIKCNKSFLLSSKSMAICLYTFPTPSTAEKKKEMWASSQCYLTWHLVTRVTSEH